MTFSADTKCVCEVRPAVNYGPRIGTERPDILLLHYTGMGDAEGALKWLCAKESGVSCHYFVFEDGRIVQLLGENKRAHHAGVSHWGGDTDINSRSIGIEIANAGHSVGPEFPLPPFPNVQMEAVAELCRDIIDRNNIAPHLVLGHSDVAPSRKQDPGEHFDWQFLAEKGIGHIVPPTALQSGTFLQRGDEGEAVAAFQEMLRLYGYGVTPNGVFDTQTHDAVTAFQRHFRQEQVDGVADLSTVQTLRDLLAALPAALKV